MISSKKQSNVLQPAKAIIELSSKIADIEDFLEFPVVLEETVNNYFHVDWMSMFNDSIKLPQIQVATNPHLPFNWPELYQEVADYDYFRRYIYTLMPGQVGIYRDVWDLTNEEEEFCVEFTKKHTDAVHYLSMPAIKNDETTLCFSFFRTDETNPFTMGEKQFVTQLAPLIMAVSKTMMVYSGFALKRTALEKLYSLEKIKPLIFNENLTHFELPESTISFFKKAYHTSDDRKALSTIFGWINSTIAPKGKIEKNSGPWVLKLTFQEFDLYCYAYSILSDKKKPILFIRFKDHKALDTFSVLRQFGLTKREVEALEYLPLGYTNKQIALAMNIEEVSVKKHLKNVAVKLNATGKTETLYQAIQIKKDLKLLGEKSTD